MTMEKNLQDALKELNEAYLKSEIDFSESGIPTDVVISKGLCVFLLKYLSMESAYEQILAGIEECNERAVKMIAKEKGISEDKARKIIEEIQIC